MLTGNKAQRKSISRSRTPSESSEISSSDTRDRARDQTQEHLNNGPLKNGNKEILEENEEDVFEDGREETEEEEESKTVPGSPSSIHTPPGEPIYTMFSKMSTRYILTMKSSWIQLISPDTNLISKNFFVWHEGVYFEKQEICFINAVIKSMFPTL